jgi:hypothetical protein
MTSWTALRWDDGAGRLQRTEVAGDEIRDMFELEPAVLDILVVPAGQVPSLVSAAPTLSGLPHKVKHAKRGLASYLPARVRVCRIQASYSCPREAEDGIRSLAVSSDARRWRGVVVIDVPDDLFEGMSTRAGVTVLESARFKRLAKDPNPFALDEFLDAQFKTIPVSPVVQKAYLGESPAAARVRRMIVVAAAAPYPVLIVGQTGTGKEIVAQLIHQLSRADTGNLHAVNCAAISHDLLESELFGHVRGSFTGAWSDKKGLWESANHGTLFLDEIGELSLLHQAKILRALDTHEFLKVGAVEPTQSDARLITATNRDLKRMVDTGRFRKDLYYRLIALPIRTPALSEHPDDIPVLAQHLWRRIRTENDAKGEVPPLPTEVLVALQGYAWPGNVRELRGVLESMFMIACGAPPSVSLVRGAFSARMDAARGLDEA